MRIADRPNVPRLTKQEKTLLMNCARPLDMEAWGEMERERHRAALGNAAMAYYVEETTPGVSWGEMGEYNGEFKTTTAAESTNRLLARFKSGKRRRDRKRKRLRRKRFKRPRLQRKRLTWGRCQRKSSTRKVRRRQVRQRKGRQRKGCRKRKDIAECRRKSSSICVE